MAFKTVKKKLFKILRIAFIAIVVLMAGFHFWLVHYAEKVIQQLVEKEGKGKIKLEIDNFSFNWLSRKIAMENVTLYTLDTINATTAYRFDIEEIKMNVTAVLPILFKKRVLINDLVIAKPSIYVTQLKKQNKPFVSLENEEDDIPSIPKEAGKIYKGIQTAINKLEIKNLSIQSAALTLTNKLTPQLEPVHISHLDFDIKNLKVDTTAIENNEKIFFSDNITLASRNQNIMLPNGRHQIQYNNFHLDVAKQLIQFDSCTITAGKTEQHHSAFSVFFHQLQLKNIDFDTLYRAEVIRADSVNCITPAFKLQVDLDSRSKVKKTPPSLERMVSEFAGDLDIRFLGVKNADIEIETIKNNKPNSFSAYNNHFEVKGLSVNTQKRNEINVEGFKMAIRQYETFLKDSLYQMKFDSLLINNDKIELTNFEFKEMYGMGKNNHFTIPQFELIGFSWDDFLFNQSLSAYSAVLQKPEINYTQSEKSVSPKLKKENKFFDAIATANESFSLNNISVYDGNIRMRLNKTFFDLKNTSFSIASNELLASDEVTELKRSVKDLSVEKGNIKINDFDIKLNNARFSGNNSRLLVDNLSVKNEVKNMDAKLQHITINNLLLNENSGDISVSGLSWEKGNVFWEMKNNSSSPQKTGTIELKKIKGENTKLHLLQEDNTLKSLITNISIDSFVHRPGAIPILTGLSLKTYSNSFTNKTTDLVIDSIAIVDNATSSLKKIAFTQNKEATKISIGITHVQFTPNIQSILARSSKVSDIVIYQPNIKLEEEIGFSKKTIQPISIPALAINQLTIQEPTVYYSKAKNSIPLFFSWQSKEGKKNIIILTDVKADSSIISTKNIQWSMSDFSFSSPENIFWNTEQASLQMQISNFSYSLKDAGYKWQGLLQSLSTQNIQIDSFKNYKASLTINNLDLKNLWLNDSIYRNPYQLLNANSSFQIQGADAVYITPQHRYSVNGMQYSHINHTLLVDSFSLLPIKSREDFFAEQSYQTDYMQLKTGRIKLGKINWEKWRKDTVLSLGNLTINNANFQTFRDKQLPFKHGIIKPLFTGLVRKIPIKTEIDSIVASNSYIEYGETHPKTGKAGAIPIYNFNAVITHLKNYNVGKTDSLYVYANADLFNAIPTQLWITESYTDSLSGFVMIAKLKSSDLKVLNNAINPMAHAEVKSGYLDSLILYVKANDYVAYGNSQMTYNKLKIAILKNGHEKKTRKLLSWIANTFIIKKKNKGKNETLFFERIRDRSMFNYIVKIAIAGVKNNATIISSKKMNRRYKKALKRLKLQPL